MWFFLFLILQHLFDGGYLTSGKTFTCYNLIGKFDKKDTKKLI